MSNQEDFLRKARMAALMAADDDEGKDVAPAEDEDALVSEKTKENLKKAGALAAVAGRWGFGKAKEVTKAASEKASAAKAEFEAKRAASAKRKAEEALAVETKALAEREAALPVAEAPPIVVAPVCEDSTDTMAKDHLLGAADVDPSGLLRMDGMGSLPATLSENLIDIEVQAPGQGVSLDDMSGEDVEAALAALTSVPESTAPVQANNPGQKNRKDFSAVEVFWIGILTATFATLIVIYLLNRQTSAPVATPATVAPQAAPVIVEPVTLPIEAPVEEPAATVPEVAEAPAVVAPPVVQETPVAAPASKPTPVAPVVQASKPAPVAVVAKPKPAPVKPAPVVVAKPKPAPKVAAPVVKDPDKQLEEMEAWFEKQNQK